MTLRIWLVAAFLLLAGLSGCGEELPGAVPSAPASPTAAELTAPVLPTPTVVEQLRSDTASRTHLRQRARWGSFSASVVSCFPFRRQPDLFCKASWSRTVVGAGLPPVAL